jgi:hypothetical protein
MLISSPESTLFSQLTGVTFVRILFQRSLGELEICFWNDLVERIGAPAERLTSTAMAIDRAVSRLLEDQLTEGCFWDYTRGCVQYLSVLLSIRSRRNGTFH